MGSDIGFVEYVVGQIDAAREVTFKKMFGEFGLYSHGKMFGSICDDQLFIKPTDPGRAYIGAPVEAPPYPGAKPNFLIQDGLERPAWLSELVRLTTDALPEPRKKSKKKG